MAAPTVKAIGALSVGTSGTTPQIPASPAPSAGNLMFLFVETANQVIAEPSGWVEQASSPQGTGTTGTGERLTVFARRWHTGDGNPSLLDSGDHTISVIVVVDDGCTDQDADATFVTSGDVQATLSTSVTIPGLDTIADDSLVLAVCSHGTDTATAQFSSFANSDLTDFAEIFDDAGTQGNGGGIGIASGVRATIGTVGNTTATLALQALQGHYCIAIQPFTTSVSKSGSESFSLTEDVVQDFIFAAQDSLTQSEATTGLSAQTSRVDSWTVTDSSSLSGTAALPVSDSLTQSEATAGLSAQTSRVDSWTVTDSSSLSGTAALPVSDSLTQSEATTGLSAQTSRVDSWTVTDSSALVAAALVAESSTISEAAALAITAQIAGSDALTIADASTLVQTLALLRVDAFVGSESAAIAAALSALDAVSVTDTVTTVGQQDEKAGTDALTLTDVAALQQTLSILGNDSLVLSEASQLALSALVVDSLVLSELVSMSATMSAADAASLVEAAALISSTVSASDALTASELSSLATALSTADEIALAEFSILNSTNAIAAFDNLTLIAEILSVNDTSAPLLKLPTRAAIETWAAAAVIEAHAVTADVSSRALDAAIQKILTEIDANRGTTTADLESKITTVTFEITI